MRRNGSRLRGLLAAGLVDSFGLALGWTVFTLYAVSHQGLGAAGLYNGAMLLGVALSAPAAGWLTTRLDGRALLRSTAVAEAVLRVATFILLLREGPELVVALGVVLMNVIAWTGYAGMRAEAASVDSASSALTWYAVCVGGIEAAGAACAALLPTGSDRAVGGQLLTVVIAAYALSLAPTFVVAGGSVVVRATRRARRLRLGRDSRPLAAGFVIMMLASGPTLLGVPLALTLYGSKAVAASAIVFACGALLAPFVAGALDRCPLPTSVVWPAVGAATIAGWIAAPVDVGGLLVAQFLSGLFITVFQGAMDARLAARSDAMTSALAYAAASRSLGSAVAVAAIPTLTTATAIGRISAAATLALVVPAVTALILWLVAGRARARAGDGTNALALS